MKIDKEIRHRFWQCLPTIRAVAGLSAQDIADLLGVTRTTIANIESNEEALTVVYYLAMRQQISSETQSKYLPYVLNHLVDKADVKDRDRLADEINAVVKSVGRRPGAKKWQAAIDQMFLEKYRF